MAYHDQNQSLAEALDKIEATILPSISMVLDTLLDAATRGKHGADAEIHAAELRTIALQPEALTRQVEAITPAYDSKGYRITSAA